MVSSIQSGIPIQQNYNRLGTMDRVTPEQINRPGLYSLDQAVMADIGIQPPKEESSFFGTVGKLVVGALVATVAAVGIRKGLMTEYTVGKEVPKENVEKIKHYFAKYTDAIYDNTVGKIKTLLANNEAKNSKTEGGKTDGATGAKPEGSAKGKTDDAKDSKAEGTKESKTKGAKKPKKQTKTKKAADAGKPETTKPATDGEKLDTNV